MRVPPVPLPSDGPHAGLPPGSAAGAGSPPASFPPYDVAGSGDLSIRRFVLCKDVKGREPVEPARSFRRSRDGRIWVFIDAANAGSGTRKLAVSFESSTRAGARTPPLALEIPPAPRHRTWAWATAWRPPGAYDAVVRDEAGAIVARGRFEVTD
ncbi:MAG: hypothetical protein QME96_16380 [Myxococcota bacterium]|nr:hypothetical protein [Myxococcota bacterium]